MQQDLHTGRPPLNCLVLLLLMLAGAALRGQEPALVSQSVNNVESNGMEFFESKIRPVLVEHCYECHNSHDRAEADLTLDLRSGLREVLTLGKDGAFARDSQLMSVIRHEIVGVEMPEDGPKLSEQIIEDFETWLSLGAPDPRDAPPSADELEALTSWESIREQRKKWWSFQPIRREFDKEKVDQFVEEKLFAAGLEFADPADKITLIRRLYFALIGLPPTPQEINAFLADQSPRAYEQIVDRLLDSPHFGERWARHWMDWVRYAESHGSEGDPKIHGAELYRDYLIRALNADVPFDQLLREHIAGDGLSEPRINEKLGINESLIGTAHWRMVFHGFAPTDALDEKVRFTDDAINTFSKAFLGITVSCARCHNHKFDAVSQKDYYALFGILTSTRPGRAVIETPEKQLAQADELAKLNSEIRELLFEKWLSEVDELHAKLADSQGLVVSLTGVRRNEDESDKEYAAKVYSQYDKFQKQLAEFNSANKLTDWNLANAEDFSQWYRYGSGVQDKPTSTASIRLHTSGEQIVRQVLPAGAYSSTQSDKHAARLESQDFLLQGDQKLWLQVIGDGQAMTRYVVQDYPRNGTVFPVRNLTSKWKWQSFDLKYWEGDDIHVEVSTANDAPLLVKSSDRSWFGIRRVVCLPAAAGGPPTFDLEHLEPVFELRTDLGDLDLAESFAIAVKAALEAVRTGTPTDAQARLLQSCLDGKLLSNSLAGMPALEGLVKQYRELEEQVISGTRVPTLSETIGQDSPLFERGDHKRPGELVPRRFLEAIDPQPYDTRKSGRIELARDMLRSDNPFTARVVVNRIWHHLFGTGIVPTPDNFGRLGAEPSHPELLDFLATTFREQDAWSIKSMIRRLVMSRTWRQSSSVSDEVKQRDPNNQLWGRAFVRRLDAEAIRDSLLVAANALDDRQFGPSVSGRSNRRSIYVNVIRNRLDPFLTTFDAPVPFSSKGRRDVTNVPAQSLLMMNSPRVRELARRFATNYAELEDRERLSALWRRAFGSEPGEAKLRTLEVLKDQIARDYSVISATGKDMCEQLKLLEKSIDGIIEPARDQLSAQSKSGTAVDLKPIHEWLFDTEADEVGKNPIELGGSAKLKAGKLILDGNGWAETKPLQEALTSKSLELIVELSDFKQRGSGLMTLQDEGGNEFDSLVLGEKQQRRWLAGSNNFRRTQEFVGGEAEASASPIHLVLVYDKNGEVALFRNGEQYGSPYRTQIKEFRANKHIVSFGIRHGRKLTPGRMFEGSLLEARIYDRALSSEEVKEAASQNGSISRKQILDSLSESERSRLASLEASQAKVSAALADLKIPVPNEEWIDVAHALFNMKEFIYVR